MQKNTESKYTEADCEYARKILINHYKEKNNKSFLKIIENWSTNEIKEIMWISERDFLEECRHKSWSDRLEAIQIVENNEMWRPDKHIERIHETLPKEIREQHQ